MARYYYHGWTESEETLLAEIMLSGMKRRKKVDDLFVESADKLDRTIDSCKNRWYQVRGKYITGMNTNKAV